MAAKTVRAPIREGGIHSLIHYAQHPGTGRWWRRFQSRTRWGYRWGAWHVAPEPRAGSTISTSLFARLPAA